MRRTRRSPCRPASRSSRIRPRRPSPPARAREAHVPKLMKSRPSGSRRTWCRSPVKAPARGRSGPVAPRLRHDELAVAPAVLPGRSTIESRPGRPLARTGDRAASARSRGPDHVTPPSSVETWCTRSRQGRVAQGTVRRRGTRRGSVTHRRRADPPSRRSRPRGALHPAPPARPSWAAVRGQRPASREEP